MRKLLILLLLIICCIPKLSAQIKVIYGDKPIVFTSTSSGANEVFFKSKALPDLTIKKTSSLSYISGKEIKESILEISSKNKLKDDLVIEFPVELLKGFNVATIPMKNGTVNKQMPGIKVIAGYRCSGMQEKNENDLALPMMIVENSVDKYAIMTDPYFSSYFEDGFIRWCYPKEVGLEDNIEKRTIVEIKSIDGIDEGMEFYYNTILKDVPPGPAWAKDIAMISYDYMSDNGKGWYNDIDELTALTSLEDRGKIALCLHGWYDVVGKYCFNEESGKLEPKWTNLIRNIELSLDDIHHRINYAKDRGFKVVMYFADGVLSSRGLPDYNEDNSLSNEGWNGPDIIGGPYHRNIGNKRYYNFYLNYAKALFTEFANDADAFVWDETFYITATNLGNDKLRSYLPRTQMRLIKDIASILHSIAPGKAFLTSDAIAPQYHPQNDVPPYALFSDGTYQDSHSRPDFWSYGIFPNYRNTMWSCSWECLSLFKYTTFAVYTYNTPVVFTNGWGNDRGFSEMTPEEKDNFIKLFNYRKQFKTKLKSFDSLPLYYEDK